MQILRKCLCLAALLSAIAGCNHQQAKAPVFKPPEVLVTGVVEDDITDVEDFTGSLEAYRRVELQSRVTGYLMKRLFREGSLVKKGQLLFEIDDKLFQADLDKSQADVVKADARYRRLTNDLARAQELLRTRSLSKEEFEKEAGDQEEAKAAVGVAEADARNKKVMLEYTKIRSPIDGIISRTMLDEGNLVRADQTTLTTIVTQDPIYAYFDVDERTQHELNRLIETSKIEAIGSKTKIRFALADEENFPREGTMDFTDVTIDQGTGTKRYRAIVPNPSGLLEPGTFIRVRFQVGTPRRVLMIPEQGVGADQGQKFVYVVNDKNEVEYRKIATGRLDRGMRVVEEGLKPGDRVIVSGLQRVRPTAKVDPKPAPPSSLPARPFAPTVVGAMPVSTPAAK
ncbi:MAG TPA: efflux RND transporter periplasmic adaptor subunit [Gemmataceae bacterium]|jgi:RND family efflux transporter MFP subunit|nr:efflux RND transporter periplasmic adaptor subunit [Gemmataceae bacterium]